MMKKRLEGILKEGIQSRKFLAERDIEFFAEYYLEKHIQGGLGELHKEWLRLATNSKRIVIAAPRGHSKSTIFGLVYILWCILHNKKQFIVILSSTFTQAEESLGSIIEELENNERITRDYGSIAGYIPQSVREKKKWTMSDIVTTTGIKVIARGWQSKIRGVKFGATRPDLILIDDIENDENVQSLEQRQKLRGVFNKSILNLGDYINYSTQYIMIGTILHYDSLLQNVLNNPPIGWDTKLYRAIINGQALWHEKFTTERLEEKKKEIGIAAFEQEYMNNPLDASSQIIKPREFYENFEEDNCDYYGYIDLAISKKEVADYTAIVTIGRHRGTGKLYVADATRMRGDVTDLLDLCYEKYTQYRYVAFGVESNQFQRAFAQWLTSDSNKRHLYLPVVEVINDKDKVKRVKEIAIYIDNGTVIFNNYNEEFISEIMQFPKGSHDDYVDALAGCIKLIVTGGFNGEIVSAKSITYEKI